MVLKRTHGVHRLTMYKTTIVNISSLFIAVFLLIVVFGFGDAETYLFPRIIALGIAALAVLQFFEAPDTTTKPIHFKVLLPGLVVCFVYILVLEWLGFYAASALAFFSILLIYNNKKENLCSISFKLCMSIAFTGCLYLLFWLVLNVRTPQGFLL